MQWRPGRWEAVSHAAPAEACRPSAGAARSLYRKGYVGRAQRPSRMRLMHSAACATCTRRRLPRRRRRVACRHHPAWTSPSAASLEGLRTPAKSHACERCRPADHHQHADRWKSSWLPRVASAAPTYTPHWVPSRWARSSPMHETMLTLLATQAIAQKTVARRPLVCTASGGGPSCSTCPLDHGALVQGKRRGLKRSSQAPA